MQPSLRAIIAYIAGCLVSGNCYRYVFDQFQDKVITYTGTFDSTNISVQDHDCECDITGMILGNMISFYHSGVRMNFNMNVKGDSFTGNVGDSNRYYGTVAERLVRIYDYQEGKYFNFCLINETAGN